MKNLSTISRICFASIVTLFLLSCNRSKLSHDNVLIHHASSQLAVDTLPSLLEKSLLVDSIEFASLNDTAYKSFLFFKSGHLLNKTDKNALVIMCSADTTYSVKLYALQNKKWVFTDSINGLTAFIPRFDLKLADYNFDSQSDIYIQVSASDGWSLSRGHLITIDANKNLELQNEAEDFANMEPNSNTKTIKSEAWNGYDAHGRHQLTFFTNKWVNGKLTTISSKDITVD